MSYEIYYDRAFICVEDKYIPLVNSGSNNCFDINLRGREICEKNWSVLNWKHKKQFLFSADEIKDIARQYDLYNQECGMMFKSRNVCFGPGEFERWVINAMKRAYTVEEYVGFGNGFYVLDYSASETKEWTRHPFKTTDELLGILDTLKERPSLDIQLSYNREVYRPKTHRANPTHLRPGDLPEYYVLKGEIKGQTVYFAKLTKYGFKYVWFCSSSAIKVFPIEKDALRYLTKYQDRLKLHTSFTPERIITAA